MGFSFLFDRSPVPNPGEVLVCMQKYDLVQNSRQQLTLLDCQGFSISNLQGEGCCGSTPTARADPWIQDFIRTPAKSGPPPPMGFGPKQQPSTATSVHKRSFQRACHRAMRDGQAGYHGRVWQLHGFPPHLVARLRSKIDHVNRAPPACRHQAGSQSALHSRLSVMHWNPWPFTEQILRIEMVVATNTYRCVDSHRNSLGV